MIVRSKKPNLEFLSELKIEHHAYFESRLAIAVLENSKLWQSVRKLSTQIKELLILNKTDAINVASSDKRVKEYLYSTELYGYLSPSPEDSEALINHLILLLNDEKTSAIQQIHIHGVFAYIIYPKLSIKPTTVEEEKRFLATLSPKELFDESMRARFELKEVPVTSKLGINRNCAFSKLISKFASRYQSPHKRALEKFVPDAKAPSYQALIKKELPFVAGPSGHARVFIQGALLYGKFDTEELKEYVLNLFAYLCIAGNHTYDEVACLVKHIGITYEQGNYLSLFPESFIQTDVFQKLAHDFNAYLDKSASAPAGSLKFKS